jgi:acyl-CoA hydrolase
MPTRYLTLDEATALLAPIDSLGLPLGPGQPIGLVHALGARTDWEHLDVLGAMLVDFYALFDHPGVFLTSTFFGPAERIYRDMGRNISFVPSDFRRFATVMEARRPRVVATMATPPDDDGWMSLSLHSGATVDEIHRAAADPERLLIVEASPHFPRTRGIGPEDHRIHADEADVICASDRRPVELADAEVTEVELAIAAYAQSFVPDGATLQTGFGSIPSTIAAVLARGGGGEYGIHSEMFTTGLMRLHQAGTVTNTHKGQFDGFSLVTFAAGAAELYEWLDGNEDVRFAPVSVVNSPECITANRTMVTINGAIAVDLWGQVTADSLGTHQFSGVGGHEDFVSGSGIELEDRALICLPATVEVGGVLRSRIVPALDANAIVTTPRHHVDVVITEFGIAELRGRTTVERARSLVEIAHPSFRDALAAAIPTRP